MNANRHVTFKTVPTITCWGDVNPTYLELLRDRLGHRDIAARMSVLPSEADIVRLPRDVRKVPIPDMECRRYPRYSVRL